MGLELMSLSSYVLATFRRSSLRSSEAGLKYFVLGALSSGMLLYGMTMIYGFAGATDFASIAAASADILNGNNDLFLGMSIGLVFLAAGLGFKVSAVPFHMDTRRISGRTNTCDGILGRGEQSRWFRDVYPCVV